MPYTKQTWVDNDPTKPLSAARMTYIENGLEAAQATAEDKSPAAHTHPTSQVVGLDATLAGKAPSTHTHAVGDLTATGTKDATTFLRGDNTWATPAGGDGGVSDHGALTGLADDDHPQYAKVVDTYTRSALDIALNGKAATTHGHTSTQITDSSAVGRSVLTAADASAVRTAIGAGTSSLSLGTSADTAKAGDYAPPAATASVSGVVELATSAESLTGTDTVRAVTPAGLKAVADTKAATSHSHSIADLPAGSTITVQKSGAVWPARPTSRADITVQWKGAAPSPAIVSSGTGGMLDGVDLRFVTT